MLLGYARGKVGDLVFSRRLGQQVTRAYNPSPLNPKSDAQMSQRTRLSGLVAAYRAMRIILDHSFTARKEGATSYNAFVSANMAIAPYLTKEQARQGVVVVLPYVVSRGVLSRIFVSGSGDDAYTNIGLGSLEITDDTTITEFSQAVIQNNAGWEEGDQLTYFSVMQTALPGQSQYPHVSAQKFKVTLSLSNEETLRTYLPDYGSATVDGFLGHGSHFASGGFCWIHSRRDASGTLQVSTQDLVCNIDNSYWTSPAQEEYAKRSYGVAPEDYLVPGTNNSSPVNVPLEIISAIAIPGNGDAFSWPMLDQNMTLYRPAAVVTNTPFDIHLNIEGNNLGLLSGSTTKIKVCISGTKGAVSWTDAGITDISVNISPDGIGGRIAFKYTFVSDDVKISGFQIINNGDVVWEFISPVIRA